MDIVFVRHGRTRINQEGRYGGFLDTEISEEGIAEIKRTEEHLRDIEFDAVYASPLKRAVQSASILRSDFIVDDRLREMNFGIFEGLSYKETLERYPNESKCWGEDYINYCLPDGESMKQVYDRTMDFIKSMDKSMKRVLVVTHGGIIGCALSSMFNGCGDFFKFKIVHGTATVISVSEDFSFIKGMNCTTTVKNLL